MNIQQIKLIIRDKKNSITGKQHIINEYNILLRDLIDMSANVSTRLQQHIFTRLDDIITESAQSYTANIDYNPYIGKKRKTINKTHQLYYLKVYIELQNELEKSR